MAGAIQECTLKEIVYHVAITLDGFIAHSDGSIDGFPMEGPHLPDYMEALQQYAVAIMGRKTYEFGYNYGLEPGANPYPNMKTYVFSQQLSLQPESSEKPPEIQTVRKEFASAVREIKAAASGSIYLCGGDQFAGLLLQEGLVDRLILKLCPVSFGEGISLWGSQNSVLSNWQLVSQKAYSNGVLLLEYSRS